MAEIKIPIINKKGEKTKTISLNIDTNLREDIFKRAVLSEQSMLKQPKGSDKMAGKKNAINLSKRRKAFRTTYGTGISRTPKKVMWSRGTRHQFVGAFAPNTKGGRRAHPPKQEKIITKKINKKEWLKALQIGFLASFTPEIIKEKIKHAPQNYPHILESEAEKISKTKEVEQLLINLGYKEELSRCKKKKVVSKRNKRHKTKRGPLIVVSSQNSQLLKSSKNLRGLEVTTSSNLSVRDFGMGTIPGRLVIFTEESAKIFKEKLKW